MAGLWIEVIGEYASNDILIDIDAEGERDDVGDAWTAESGIASFQFHDGGDELLRRTFRSWTLMA